MVTKVTGMMQTGTKGGDIPSASTLVIDTDGDYFDITGTTGITAMTVDAGRRFTLQFDGAVTLTHGSSLYLPGATSFTTEANDCLSFIATAANTVRCTGYALKDGGSPVAPAGGGLWQYASGGSISSTEHFETPNFTGDIRLEFYGILPGSDGANFTGTVSVDNASSYVSSGYSSKIMNPTGNTSFDNLVNSSSATFRVTEGGVGNASGESMDIIIETLDNSNAATHMRWFVWTKFSHQSGGHSAGFGVAGNSTADTITNFKLSHGSAYTGAYRLYTKITS